MPRAQHRLVQSCGGIGRGPADRGGGLLGDIAAEDRLQCLESDELIAMGNQNFDNAAV
jgi:hypothetical protein